MGATPSLITLVGVVLACIVVVSGPMKPANATISCGQVVSFMTPCVRYLEGSGGLTEGCCGGVRSLNNAAQSTPDRQQACRCLKQAAQSMTALKPNLAEGLPRACHVNIPYKISTSTNCDTVK